MLPEINAQASYSSNAARRRAADAGRASPSTANGATARSSRSAATARCSATCSATDYPTWTVGVSVAYPIGDSTSDTTWRGRGCSTRRRSQQLRNLELQITTQVRDAARRCRPTRSASTAPASPRELAERRLDAEEKKFAAGIQISFFVFQAQRDLSQARTNEIRAIADYNKSLVDFEAVQETALAGNAPITSAAQGTR